MRLRLRFSPGLSRVFLFLVIVSRWAARRVPSLKPDGSMTMPLPSILNTSGMLSGAPSLSFTLLRFTRSIKQVKILTDVLHQSLCLPLRNFTAAGFLHFLLRTHQRNSSMLIHWLAGVNHQSSDQRED